MLRKCPRSKKILLAWRMLEGLLALVEISSLEEYILSAVRDYLFSTSKNGTMLW
jgi:hypothetical protein